MAELISELESTKSKLHENKIRYGLLQENHDSLKSRHNALSSEADVAFNARDSLIQDNRELHQKIQQLESSLSEVNLDLRERSGANEKLERLLEIETRNSAALEAETKRLKQAMESRDDYMARVEAQLKSASDANELLEQELGALRLSSSEIAASFDSRNRRLAEHETLIEQNRARIYELENALANEQSAHSALQARHLEEGERLRGESSQLVHKTDALRGRADMAEKLLSEARGQLRSKVEELRATERQSLEARILAETFEKKLRASTEDLSKAEQRIAAMDEMRVNLVDRVNNLTKALHARDGAATSAEQKTENLARRHDDALRTAQREREQAERTVSELRDMLERERAERILAEGALQASRQGRPRRGQTAAYDAHEAYPTFEQPQLERPTQIQVSDEIDEAIAQAAAERRIAS
jgi:chromosome segregation ATPase